MYSNSNQFTERSTTNNLSSSNLSSSNLSSSNRSFSNRATSNRTSSNRSTPTRSDKSDEPFYSASLRSGKSDKPFYSTEMSGYGSDYSTENYTQNSFSAKSAGSSNYDDDRLIFTDVQHARSHKYPDDNDIYTDTTYYDRNDEYFDLGYQNLKILEIRQYPEFLYLKKLFVDHNKLKNLPNANNLPHLEYLNCSCNDLSEIPLYPKLTFLNIACNQITNCSKYKNSKLVFFDCSHNEGFLFDFFLPNCKQLYINDTKLQSIDLNLLPVLEILDCSNNELKSIGESKHLLELNIGYNSITELPYLPKLLRLMADFNMISVLPTYSKALSVTITYNNLKKISAQPTLKKLIANNNNIKILEEMPSLEVIDLRHNELSFMHLPKNAKYVSLQFNPMNNIKLDPLVLRHIKELQINFETYKNIYQTYYNNFEIITIQTNEEKLEQMLKKLSSIFDNHITRHIFRKFSTIKFRERENMLYKITLKIYWTHFSLKNEKTLEEIVSSDGFKYLLKNMTDLYYKTIVVTLFFNGYS